MQLVKEKYKKIAVLERQFLIKETKDFFEKELAKKLGLLRVSAPLFVGKETGLNDDLNGIERKVTFDILADKTANLEVVQSLAKWKRLALKKYGFEAGKGLYASMNAIRRDDDMDAIHSIYVDQYDWEKIITKETRTVGNLKQTVQELANAIFETAKYLQTKTKIELPTIEKEVFFITSENLLKQYPRLSPKHREYEITKKYKTVFVIGVGHKLSNGESHDQRAPDYDDWNLNGDLLFYHEPLDCALEISSMGIRVNETSLKNQIEILGLQERLSLPFHKGILSDTLPLTMGGGIGQSRLCMLLLGAAHVGEVQASFWSENELKLCEALGICLL